MSEKMRSCAMFSFNLTRRRSQTSIKIFACMRRLLLLLRIYCTLYSYILYCQIKVPTRINVVTAIQMYDLFLIIYVTHPINLAQFRLSILDTCGLYLQSVIHVNAFALKWYILYFFFHFKMAICFVICSMHWITSYHFHPIEISRNIA